ncbi:hypothetical protein D3C75_1239670 [compost metagenome]
MNSGAVRCTQDRAQIMRIFNFIEENQEWRFSLGFRRSQNVLKLRISKRCRLRHYPLMLYARC